MTTQAVQLKWKVYAWGGNKPVAKDEGYAPEDELADKLCSVCCPLVRLQDVQDGGVLTLKLHLYGPRGGHPLKVQRTCVPERGQVEGHVRTMTVELLGQLEARRRRRQEDELDPVEVAMRVRLFADSVKGDKAAIAELATIGTGADPAEVVAALAGADPDDMPDMGQILRFAQGVKDDPEKQAQLAELAGAFGPMISGMLGGSKFDTKANDQGGDDGDS